MKIFSRKIIIQAGCPLKWNLWKCTCCSTSVKLDNVLPRRCPQGLDATSDVLVVDNNAALSLTFIFTLNNVFLLICFFVDLK